MNGPPFFAIDVLDFTVITFEVPAERVLAHLPKTYELETFSGPRGERALISTTCFCNQNFRAAGVEYPRHTFNEITYRTYVSRHGARGVYFFGRYLGTRLAWALQRPIARHTYQADLQIEVREGPDGVRTHRCVATSDSGHTNFAVQGKGSPSAKPPFTTGEQLAQSITYRLHGYFTSGLHIQGHMPVGHPPMDPIEGILLSSARFDLWRELGILNDSEASEPHSVLMVPAVPFKLYAPRPISRRS